MKTKFTIIDTLGSTGSKALAFNESRWVKGQIGHYVFDVKVYPCGSQFGINEGNISKLSIREMATQKEVAAYDRGWDVHPASELVAEMVDALVEFYAQE